MAAQPNATGCPAGWETLEISTLDPAYELAPLVDDAGNQDGVICGLARPDAFRNHAFGGALADAPVPVLYSWRDNTVGSGR